MASRRRLRNLNPRDNRLLNTIEMRERVDVMRSYPYSIQLEVTTKCNFACIMCARDKYHGAGENLTGDILDIVMEDIFPHCQDVIVSSFGEPLLFPRLPEIFEKIDTDNGMDLGFFTNFVLMTEEMAELIIKSGVGYVNASIDGATKQSYELIRRGGKWEMLREKLRMFQEVKKRLKSETPRMNLCVVGSTLNVEEIPTFVEFAKEFGFDTVKYNHNMYVDDEKMDYLSLVHEKRKANEMFRRGFQRALELGIHTNFEHPPFDLEPGEEYDIEMSKDTDRWTVLRNKIKLKYNQKVGWRLDNLRVQSGGSSGNARKLFFLKTRDYMRDHIPYLNSVLKRPPYPHPIPNDAPPKTCGNPWTHVHIKSDGLVYPCCFSDEVMGDLRKESFEQIWNGSKYQNLRQSLRTGEYWESCRRASCNWVEGQSSVYGCEIKIHNPIKALDGTKGARLKVEVTNTGRFPWEPPTKNKVSWVSLSYRVFNEKLELIDEGLHIPVKKVVYPLQTTKMILPVKPLSYGGPVTIKVDMVHEKVTWFGERGNNAVELPVKVKNVPFGAYLTSWKAAEVKQKLYDGFLTAGEQFSLPIRVLNVGTAPIGAPELGDALTYHWKAENKSTYEEWEGRLMTPLEKPLKPGEHVDMALGVEVPRILPTGRYWLEVDLHRENLGYLSSRWHRALLAFPVKVVASPGEEAHIPGKKENGKPYLWEPRGQCVSHTGNKGIW